MMKSTRPAPAGLGMISCARLAGAIITLLGVLCAFALNDSARADSTNLGCVDVPSNPTQGEVAVNAISDCLDEAMNDAVTLTITGNTNVTATEFNRNVLLNLTGTPAADFNLTVPTNKRLFLVRNATGKIATVKYSSGGTVTVASGTTVALHGDGTDIRNIDAQIMDYGTAGVDGAADYFIFWDASAGAVKRVLGNNLPGSGGGVGTGGPALFKGAQVKRTTTQSITTATPTMVNWDAEDYDTDAVHDNATNNTRLSVPTGTGIVKVIVGACVEWADNSTGDRTISIEKNGAGAFQGASTKFRTSKNQSWECVYSAPVAVTAGTDYFEIEVTQTSGAGLNIVNGSHTWAALWAVQYTSFKGALALSNATQAITTATNTTVIFQGSESYDTDAIHDPSTNNTRFTVPSGVTRVRMTCNVFWASNGTGLRQVKTWKNGVDFDGQGNNLMHAGGSTSHLQNVVSAVVTVSGGDYFECVVQQSSGGNLNITNATGTWGALEIVE